MTKLEEKLIQLGYKNKKSCPEYFSKKNGKGKEWLVYNTRFKVGYVAPYTSYATQAEVDRLQQAFNQLSHDLEVLKEYE